MKIARRRLPSLAELERRCRNWNNAHAVGAAVELVRGSGTHLLTQTGSEAYVMSGHSAVIFLEGVAGCYDLSHVVPACL